MKQPGRLNLRWKTMGGKVFWKTLEERGGFRLQQLSWRPHHFRILDSVDIRVWWDTRPLDKALVAFEEVADKGAEENPEFANLISVANELNADCLMGIWMSSVDDEKRLEPGDIEEVLGALDKIGDDNLSADAGVEADPSEFDHGTSLQRITWFAEGFESQDVDACSKVFDDLFDGTLAKDTNS